MVIKMPRKEIYWKNPKKYNKESLEWCRNNRDKVNARQRKFREQHPKYFREAARKYRKTHKEQTGQYLTEYRKLNPKKVKAKNFIERHPELKGSKCELCDSIENLHAHHPDYDISWLIITCCAQCHSWIHKAVN